MVDRPKAFQSPGAHSLQDKLRQRLGVDLGGHADGRAALPVVHAHPVLVACGIGSCKEWRIAAKSDLEGPHLCKYMLQTFVHQRASPEGSVAGDQRGALVPGEEVWLEHRRQGCGIVDVHRLHPVRRPGSASANGCDRVSRSIKCRASESLTCHPGALLLVVLEVELGDVSQKSAVASLSSKTLKLCLGQVAGVGHVQPHDPAIRRPVRVCGEKSVMLRLTSGCPDSRAGTPLQLSVSPPSATPQPKQPPFAHTHLPNTTLAASGSPKKLASAAGLTLPLLKKAPPRMTIRFCRRAGLIGYQERSSSRLDTARNACVLCF